MHVSVCLSVCLIIYLDTAGQSAAIRGQSPACCALERGRRGPVIRANDDALERGVRI